MTNYEKYKDELIDMLFKEGACEKIKKLSGYENECGKQKCSVCCSVCEEKIKRWLEAQAPSFDFGELKTGDKIRMREIGEESAKVYEVVCNSFPAQWLRLRVPENEESFLASEYGASCGKDENFLIFYDDISKGYEIEEVFR